jgi:hypothetical protein
MRVVACFAFEEDLGKRQKMNRSIKLRFAAVFSD